MAGEIRVEKLSLEKPEIAPAKVETPSSPEGKPERVFLHPEKTPAPEKVLEKKGEGNIIAAAQVQSWQKKRADEIDSILSEGLNEVFLKMNPAQQAAFKKSGEETVAKINVLLGEAKVKVNKIIALIRQWLKLIPGVNKFFLEQEIKIKADKILRIKNKF
ncbi:MAG: hypothetical protein WC467_01480 [Patescibacteria group bacterium]